MTDFKEEQNNEVEALEAIYPEEFQLLTDKPLHKFTILVKSSTYQGNDESSDVEPGACLTLQFEYTPKYPDEPPLMEILEPDNIEEEECEPLKQLLEEQFSECAGMAMVFTLVSAAQEWINTFVEDRIKKEEEEEERLRTEEEERERKVFEGTRVTVETFMTWKAKFDAEMAALKNAKESSSDGKKRLTGKELFLADKTLNESDLSFLGEGDTAVAVDETLFENLDELELEDDDADDPDYKP
ncbi:RWD domain [Trinorchestia longiramus]|nr:RWD domain [Trinorchestia longiramus]